MVTDFELGWAAGFFDGEGSFWVAKKSSGTYFGMQLKNTDREALVRFQGIVGGAINGPYRPSGSKLVPRQPHHKDQFRWHASGVVAKAIAIKLRPHLGSRRTERLDALLEECV